jgi:tetratricopeptide (TPR) repeat protein
VTSLTSERALSERRLDGWKAIARHFGRSCRTVQRWHTDFELPIHRLGGKKGIVFAYNEELDIWMRDRGQDVMPDPQAHHRLVLIPAPLTREEPLQYNNFLTLSLIPEAEKLRSAGLVALASRMWEALSYSNLGAMARIFREAVDLDPGNAEAFAGLSLAFIAQGIWGLVRAPFAYTSAKAALQRALEINPDLTEVKCASAWLKMVAQRDWEGARRGFDEVMNSPTVIHTLAGRAVLHIAEGSLKEASCILTEAVQQFPLSAAMQTWYCWNEYLAGEYDNVIEQIELIQASGRIGPIVAAIEALTCVQTEKPDSFIGRIEALAADYRNHDVVRGALGYAYGVAGQEEKARHILDAMAYAGGRTDSRAPYAAALVLIGLNEREEAVKRLEQSYREGSIWSLGFRSDPILAFLHNDPHYQLFMSNVSYPKTEISSRHREYAE